ncbi:MAG TPA: hypothetical protein VGF52_03940 [Tepidisphaeraceae bacterium]
MCRFSRQLCVILGVLALTGFANLSRADSDDASTGTGRYGLFNGLDHRSKYATNWFPEPINSDELDQDQEYRINGFHAEKRGFQDTELSAEIEKSWQLLSIEIEIPYEREVDDGDRSEGMGNIEFSARHPLFQYVSPSGFFDYTFGGRFEIGIAPNSEISEDTEVVGAVFQTIGLGNNFSIQMSAGYSTLIGPGDDGGEQNIETTAIFGYNLDNPGFLHLTRITPEFELDGETAMNHGGDGQTALTGATGLLFAFDSIKWGEPKIQVGYIFPLNDAARQDFDWGITTSLILEF